MKALVFGKTGQVATELQRHLPEALALGRDDADLSDPAACAAAIAAHLPDVVINAAAYTAVDKAEEDEALATIVNGDAPTAMAQAAAKMGIPFVHISTDYVFEGGGARPWQADDPVAPLGAYGRSKLVGENGVRAAGERHAILRTSWVFSAHGSNFVKTMLRLSETRATLSVVNDQIGGPTEAGDIALACIEIARQMVADTSKQGGTYHYAGTPAVSWKTFACEIFEQAGRDVVVTGIPSTDYPTPAQRPLNSRMDCTSLMDDFAIPAPDWHAALARVLTDLGFKGQTKVG